MEKTETLAPVVHQMGIVFETPEEIVSALNAYAIETFEEQDIRVYLESDEITELDKEIRQLQAKAFKLEQLQKDFAEYIKKGSISDIGEKVGHFIKTVRNEDVLSDAEGYTFHPPLLNGEGLDAIRSLIRYKTKLAEKGYVMEKGAVYGIVNEETRMIDYVTAQGKPSGIPSKPMTTGQLKHYLNG